MSSAPNLFLPKLFPPQKKDFRSSRVAVSQALEGLFHKSKRDDLTKDRINPIKKNINEKLHNEHFK